MLFLWLSAPERTAKVNRQLPQIMFCPMANPRELKERKKTKPPVRRRKNPLNRNQALDHRARKVTRTLSVKKTKLEHPLRSQTSLLRQRDPPIKNICPNPRRRRYPTRTVKNRLKYIINKSRIMVNQLLLIQSNLD